MESWREGESGEAAVGASLVRLEYVKTVEVSLNTFLGSQSTTDVLSSRETAPEDLTADPVSTGMP